MSAVTLIQKNHAGVQFNRQRDAFRFSPVKILTQCGYQKSVLNGVSLNPLGYRYFMASWPVLPLGVEFFPYRLGNMQTAIQSL